MSRRRHRFLAVCVALDCVAWPLALAMWLLQYRPPTLADREAAQAASMELVRDISIDGIPLDDYCRSRCYPVWSVLPGESLLNVTPPQPEGDGSPRVLAPSPQELSRAVDAEFVGT